MGDSDRITSDIADERALQELAWQVGQRPDRIEVWLAAITEATGRYAGSVWKLKLHGLSATYDEHFRAEMRQALVKVAALAQAALADMDREEPYDPGPGPEWERGPNMKDVG